MPPVLCYAHLVRPPSVEIDVTAIAGTAIEVAARAGFDLSLIDESLRCSHEQRALQHQAALELALQLEAAYKSTKSQRRSDGTQSTSAASLRR